MKRKLNLLPVLILFFGLIFASCQMDGGTSFEPPVETPVDPSTLQYFTLSIPTAQEEATVMLNYLKQIPWFDSMGYRITLPNTPLVNSAISKLRAGGTLTSAEEAALRTHFIQDVYDVQDYQPSFNTIARAALEADQQIPSLRTYQSSWGFFIPNKYTIQLTYYGPGGSYNPSTGLIIMKVDRENYWNPPRPLSIILHEAVHIGIENNIIQRNNIPQWTKERIVDHFMILQFGLSGYRLQSTSPEYPIDIIFNQPDVLDHLPSRVEEFMRQHR